MVIDIKPLQVTLQTLVIGLSEVDMLKLKIMQIQ
jgi:hypothetical protein